jgi:choline dehydrogenase-like flavoprotein
MLIDARTIPEGSQINVDLCIVGGGPAGISVALPFLNSSTTVAIIETGGLDFDEVAQIQAEATSSGHDYFPMKETRIRAFGGSTMSWGGISAPLDTIDFEKRSWVPHSGWPVSREDLDPYYDKAKAVSHVLNPDASSAGSEGYFGDENGPTRSTRWAEVYFSAPARFGRLYEQEFKKAPNITTYLYSTAVELESDESQSTISGLRAASLDGSTFRIVANEYVLAGGGIENARIMLASGNKERGGIGNDHDLVGRFFQEHPRMYDRFALPEDSDGLASHVRGAAGTLHFSRLGLSDAVQNDEELLNYIVNLSFGYSGQLTDQFQAVRRMVNARRKPWSDSPYFQDVGGGPNTVRWEDVKTALKKPHRSFQSALGAQFEPDRMRKWIQIETNVEQVPSRDNRVTLNAQTDAFGVPKAHLHWNLDAEEERTYRRGLELIVQALDQFSPGLADGQMEYPDPWPDEVFGCWHHIGTTRMHESPSEGVVDANCRVHGVANLFVAGSSVFPTGGATSPTLTIVALGLRLAEHLKANDGQPT